MIPKIIFEDEFLLVIDKPSGMVVNNSDTTAKIETVQKWAEQKILPISNTTNTTNISIDFYKRAGIVHRLDKETSGILLIAKTPEAFSNLQAQFKERVVKKKYLALAHGKVVPETGTINAPIGRLPWNRERFGVMPGGREAQTKYKLITNYQLPITNENFSFLELYPQTGRTHQIRVHLQYLGFPIVGDTFYAGRKQAQEDRKFCPRVFLHAAGISFLHPKTAEKLELNSPLPKDLENILNKVIQ